MRRNQSLKTTPQGRSESINSIGLSTRKKFRRLRFNKTKYSKLKYNSEIYKVGDCIIIQEKGNKHSVGKLLEILPFYKVRKNLYWPKIKIQWYYSKNDINLEKNGIDKESLNSLSDFEIFKSSHKDIIYIETIVCKCQVLKIEDYTKLMESTDSDYFYRAEYNPQTETLNPPFKDWERVCVCNKVFNPDDLYLKCDKCNKYFHPECVRIKREDIEHLNDFYCDSCKQ